MTATLAFDIYGTLIDTQGVVEELSTMVGEAAAQVSRSWRDKQLEYAFRRGLMGRYQPFSDCTSQALDYALALHQCSVTARQRQQLLDRYRRLPAFSDAASALQQLGHAGHRLWAFSNGQAAAVETLLASAGVLDTFDGIVSVDEIGRFKPDPAVYAHFLKRTAATAESTWLVSSNPFDVLGARSVGWQAAWVQRSAAVPFDDWEWSPTVTVERLDQLVTALPG
ncbi:haloacid dehalogenase, type II [Saccharospirillum sp. MSK14-1]|uniref:haloacid dehalogenase type II n=1 Tax=Saccharospirillum sp. MSK14-1 TaxID=1897632 RepID=UPI000D3AC116|nr:haloacid dehalogenase type II [Saccharospirillum sp. MSK14-1]PTY37808.1 haloacid dehalogenase, type II [Saccharospirillum sp. MSK14-1]